MKKNVVPKRLPTGEVVFTGVGRKTANVLEIRTRFESLGVQTDWKRFDKISALRNDIEHYCTSVHPDAIRGMISDTFVIIRDFRRRAQADQGEKRKNLNGASVSLSNSVISVVPYVRG